MNRTGLAGLFTLSGEGWRPMRLPPPPPGGAAPMADPFAELPTIFTALGKLGLDLTRQQAAVPFCTVEQIERPSGNR